MNLPKNYTGARKAIALSYDEDKPAPFVAAKGSEERAEAIIKMAEELGLYVHKDEVLLSELQSLNEGEEVPVQLYGIIAAILAFSYMLQGKTPSAWTRPDGTRAINIDA